MNNPLILLIFILSLLGMFSGCNIELQKKYISGPTRIMEHACYWCHSVPAIKHIRIINERETISMYVCEEHLASYILETPEIDFIKEQE